MGAMFEDAPAHSTDVIRITFVTSFFWYRAELALEVVDADVAWKAAKVAVVLQVGAWYMYCSIIKFKWCTRKDLIALDFYGQGLKVYAAEMTHSLDQIQPFCTRGRASALGCYVQTVSWSNGARDKKAYRAMNVPLRKEMTARATPSFRLVDFFGLGEVMPEEVVEGHGSQLLNLWMWTVMFNAICPAELASQKAQAVFTGTMCTAAELSYSKCPQYHKLCKYNTEKLGGPICMNWACLNSVPCTLSTRTSPKILAADDAGLCEDEMNFSAVSTLETVPTGMPWILSLTTATLALALKLALELAMNHPPVTTPAAHGAPRADAKVTGPEGEAVHDSLLKAEADPLPQETKRPSQNQFSIPKAGHQFATGLALFLASSHVIISEIFQQGLVAPWDWYGWGEVWIPWLIMVCGFMLFASELRISATEEETISDYQQRCPSTFFFYPLYALGLFISFVSAKFEGRDLNAVTLVAQAFLVQSWVPGVGDQLQPQCWFLSCLALYWILFKFIAQSFKRLNLLQTICLMLSLLLLPWPLMAWAWGHRRAHSDLTDLALNLGSGWEHHPISYLHVFLLGMLLAKLRQLLDPLAADLGDAGEASSRNPYVIGSQVLAPLGYLGLLLIQSLQAFALLKPLLLFQVLILAGLVGLPSLPLPFTAYAFSKLNFLEDWDVGHMQVGEVEHGELETTRAWAVAIRVGPTAMLVMTMSPKVDAEMVDIEPTKDLASTSAFGPADVHWFPGLAVLVIGCALIPSTSLPSLPSFVLLQSELVDLRVAAELRHPALLVRPKQGEVMLVAQKQFITWSRRLGVYRGDDGEVWHAVILEETIHSDLVLGVQPLPSGNSWRKWKDQSQSPLLAFPVQVWTGLRTPQGMPWKDLCVAEQWFPANRTLLRRRVTGPEAGKLVALHRSWDESDDVVMVFESAPPRGDVCPSDEDVPVTQMYLSLDVHVSKPDKHIGANRLDYGFFNAKEKNWIPFIYNGSLHFVYPPVPHVIVSAQEDGRSQRLYSTTYLPLHRLRQKSPHAPCQICIVGQFKAIFAATQTSNT
ncbi:unnamed protein product [Cladocopium goreaui]|uniref:Protein FAM3B n=1 Tax=Cladocopium goreaui TaxID=2562237 RepID=A0A9P1GU94_9DINO|nr:unnamed protein product [Cladocopium goreaui]